MAKERWPETDVLTLSHADQPSGIRVRRWNKVCDQRHTVVVLCKGSGYSLHSAASMAITNQWQAIVERNLMNIALDESDYYWPSDTLFHYYLLMEVLQENLHERQELLQMLTQAVLSFNDT